MNAPPESAAPLLDDRYALDRGAVYLSGTQALVRLVLDQQRLDARNGLNTAGFVSGYPGSPVGNVDREMERARAFLDRHHIVHTPGLNEELAATAAFGTQMLHEVRGARHDGVFALWFGKAPGVDRSGDAFHHHNFRGVGRNGGVLAVAGDDPHARSTVFPSDSNLAFYKFFMPVLAPSNLQEVLDFGLHGFALSRACNLWVGFKFVTDIADSGGVVQVSPERVNPVVPEVLFDGIPFKPVLRANMAGPPMIETERVIHDGSLEVARRYAALNGLNRIVVRPGSARIGIVTVGKTYCDVRQALDDLGLDESTLAAKGVGLLKIGMPFPLEPDIVREFARGLDEIVVIEDKRPFLELFVKDLLYGEPERPRVVGKHDDRGEPLLPVQGELSPEIIARALLRRLGTHVDSPAGRERARLLAEPPRPPTVLSTARVPYFCSGCPHNTGLKLPEGSVVGAGIGCHIMTLWMGPQFGEVHGYTQMGGEGATWVGLQAFTDTKHFFQNLGDGTFAHSGSLALRFAVASKANVTYKLLVNGTVAMTGGQDVAGGMSVPSLVALLEAEGVKRVIVTTDDPDRYPGGHAGSAEVWHRERLLEAERLLASTPGVTVLLHEQQCATEKRRMRKREKLATSLVFAHINARVCEGCGDCGRKSNCLSVQPLPTPFGDKAAVHQSSCNQDLSCLQGDCPSFVTVESGASPLRAKAAPIPFPEDVTLPDPVPIVPSRRFSMCLTGVGGTGVVTVNQVLGMAAFRCGLQVQTYDQTGASQKAGPVVSHLKIRPPGEDGAPTVGMASADLYLVFDALGGANDRNLVVAAPERTVAIVSTTAVPTGEMVGDRSRQFPSDERLRELLDMRTRRQENAYVDAQRYAERLTGDHMASNFFLVGVAYQSGALPIDASAIEEALGINGVSARMNVTAFRWGRLAVSDRARVDATLSRTDGEPIVASPTLPPALRSAADVICDTAALRDVVTLRAADLVAYQNEACARRYLDQLRRVREAERARTPGRDELSLAVARQLYRLTAVKDEYESARLLLEPSEQQALVRRFGPDAKLRWHLHPSFLRRLGVDRKVALGPWFRPVLWLLARAKGLRGSALDPFGRSEVRRMERSLLRHYEELLPRLIEVLHPENHAQVTALAALPDMIRGYEAVKWRNACRYSEALQPLAAALRVDIAWEPPAAPEPIRTGNARSA